MNKQKELDLCREWQKESIGVEMHRSFLTEKSIVF